MLNTAPPINRKEHFLREIKGSHVVIPDLYAFFSGWKFGINSSYETVKKQTDAWVERYIPSVPACLYAVSLLVYSAGSKVTYFDTACKSPISPSSQLVSFPTLQKKSAS